MPSLPGYIIGGGGGSVTAAAVGAVLADATAEAGVAEDVRAVLAGREALPDTGWTDDVTGTATAAHSSGVHTLGTNASGAVMAHRATTTSPECPAIEIIGRFDVTSGAPATGWWSGFALLNAASTYSCLAQVVESGAVQLWHAHGSGYGLVGSGGSVSLTSGDVWLRLIVTPSYIAASYGTGSGSTPPTSWTTVAYANTVASTLAAGHLNRIAVHAARNGSGSGTYTVEWRNVTVKSLSIAA